ncbi:unnamed protein product [Bursaphelenchus xylophilus]|uniref:(pine wood nematode) hypothetical protein n=1 Tax=Bursaphelenchus xylophilus TaxID=6326 RepID=A0A1I7RHW3_BURXY|nr:unnamed protein product [Bursaphelenchus xylophilus]CAG9115327.1 unnamed protein product [Bursaphelenchus xylophilus]
MSDDKGIRDEKEKEEAKERARGEGEQGNGDGENGDLNGDDLEDIDVPPTPTLLVSDDATEDAEEDVKSLEQELSALTVAEASRLTPRKCEILLETFTALKRHLVHNIQTLFIRLFSEYPTYKDIWPQFRAIPDSSLMYSNELKKHVHVFCKGLTMIINSLNTEKELYVVLRKLAKAHARKNVYKNHIMNMLPELLNVMKSNGIDVNDDVKEAWTTLFDVLGNLVDPLKTDNLNSA